LRSLKDNGQDKPLATATYPSKCPPSRLFNSFSIKFVRSSILSDAYFAYFLSSSTRSCGLASYVVGSCISLACSRMIPRKWSIFVATTITGTSLVCSDTALKRSSLAVCCVRALLFSRQNLRGALDWIDYRPSDTHQITCDRSSIRGIIDLSLTNWPTARIWDSSPASNPPESCMMRSGRFHEETLLVRHAAPVFDQ